MLKQSIPTASRKWPINHLHHYTVPMSYRSSLSYEIKMRNYFMEADVPHSIRTDLSVNDLSMLEIFAKANELISMKFGYWESLTGWYKENKVCYVLLQPTEQEEANLIYMNLKYGSFEKAFKEYQKEIGKYR